MMVKEMKPPVIKQEVESAPKSVFLINLTSGVDREREC